MPNFRVGAVLILLLASTTLIACSPSQMHREKLGCFRSQPLPVRSILQDKKELFWPVAHRGGSEFGVPNSLTALQKAARSGLPFLEIDVRSSSDGKLYVFHDSKIRIETVLTTPEAYGKFFSALSNQEIQQLMLIGSFESPPTLQSVFQNLSPFNSMLFLDVKGGWSITGRQTLSLAHQLGWGSRIVYQCYSAECVQTLSKEYPQTIFLIRVKKASKVAAALHSDAQIVQFDLNDLSLATVEAVHRRGARVLVKTLNSEDTEKTWKTAHELGVDLVLTSFPRKLWKKHSC